MQAAPNPRHADALLTSLPILQVGDTVRLIVQDVDIARRRLSLALEKPEAAHKVEAAVQSTAPTTAAAGYKRPVKPLGTAGPSGSGPKRQKQ